MGNATHTTVAAFGAIAALAGIEHGVGEVLQGNVAPEAVIIASWPDSAFFRILAGEPAMTVIPDLLASGIASITVALILLAWATMMVQRKHGGLVLIVLSVVLLLVGGGIGPPLLGIILGVAAMRIGSPLVWWRAHASEGLRGMLRGLWPWSLAAALVAWLWLCPGVNIADYYFGVDNPDLVYLYAALAFGLLLLTIVTAHASDSLRRAGMQQPGAG